jgi:D-alanyl-lipoteichoic acid acyltransferase DltB (MBOAT superfamily)
MIFSSVFFIFAFLPAVILGYYGQHWLFENRLRNLTLLIFSYLFYLFGAPDFILFPGRIHPVRLCDGPLAWIGLKGISDCG